MGCFNFNIEPRACHSNIRYLKDIRIRNKRKNCRIHRTKFHDVFLKILWINCWLIVFLNIACTIKNLNIQQHTFRDVSFINSVVNLTAILYTRKSLNVSIVTMALKHIERFTSVSHRSSYYTHFKWYLGTGSHLCNISLYSF